MPFDPTGHIDLADLKATLLGNIIANDADPEGFDEWQRQRNKHARPVKMDSPIPKAPELNPDGSEKQEDPKETQEAQEVSWFALPDTVLDLLEDEEGEEGEDDLFESAYGTGFTGEITDSIGRKRKYINGKPVKREGDTGNKKTWRARVNGEKVHVLSHDSDNGLVSVKGIDGNVRVVSVADLDHDRGGQAREVQQPNHKTSAPLYNPDPTAINPETGLADKARVGVPAMQTPPPPAEIGRLPNLNPKQRKVEAAYAEAYLSDPDKLAGEYLKALKKRKVGEYPNLFGTDDVKALNRDWNPAGAGNLGEKLPDNVKKAMAANNAAVHQTANAIAKRAFVKYLDDVVQHMPAGKRNVLVSQGGCASGKGSSLKHATDPKDPHFGMLPAADRVGAIWDAAGEENAIENEWVLQECQKRGIKATFAYVWADPTDTWGGDNSRGVIRRALRKGRMVDARLFADSYAVGAKNFKAFVDKHPDANFIFLDNRDKKSPKVLDKFPEETLAWDAEAIYRDAVKVIEQRKSELTPAIMAGGLGGGTIWGMPT